MRVWNILRKKESESVHFFKTLFFKLLKRNKSQKNTKINENKRRWL